MAFPGRRGWVAGGCSLGDLAKCLAEGCPAVERLLQKPFRGAMTTVLRPLISSVCPCKDQGEAPAGAAEVKVLGRSPSPG